ncbi:hypothetical protein [Roseateles sp.]|uniref:hypothetical protein n=1 Tax=Roseateles sp. TaxID=1971397 RepID=UPI0039E771EB
MGLEFLFAPITMLVFAGVMFGLVLLQRLLFRSVFAVLGAKQVTVGYAIVLVLSLVLGAISGGDSLRASAANGLLACYLSLMFVTLGLLPLSLLLARRGKVSIAAVIGAGVLLSIVIGVGMVLTVGLDRVVERGAGWLTMQGSTLGFLVAVSIAFALGQKTR